MKGFIKDRGKIKWTPFMLPEHNKEINKLYREMNNIEKPVLDEQQLERLDALVKEAIRDQFTVKLVYCEGKRLLNLEGNPRVESGKLYLDDKYLMVDNVIDITLI